MNGVLKPRPRALIHIETFQSMGTDRGDGPEAPSADKESYPDEGF